MTINDALKGRDNNFNLVRFLAAFAVLFDHISLASLGPGVHRPVFEQVFGISLSELAVNMFFVLSGFLVTKSLLTRNNIISYLAARVLRLFPAFAIMVVVTTFGLGLYFTSYTPSAYISSAQTFHYWLGTMFTFDEAGSLPGVFTDNPRPNLINSAIWTLKYEVIAYAALLALWFLSILEKRTVFAVLSSVFLVFALLLTQLPDVQISPHSTSGGAWVSLIRFGLCFQLGSAFYCYRDRIPLSGRLALIGLTASYVAIDWHAYEVISILATGYALMWVSLIPAGRVRLFNAIGDYSYGIYIWHWPIIQALIASQFMLPFGWLLTATSVITLILAIVSWHLIERPALGCHQAVARYVGRLYKLVAYPVFGVR